MMKSQRAVLAVILTLMCLGLIGCLGPRQISPVDRALIFNDQYEALEITYKHHWEVATDSEKEWLAKKVAPAIDKMRAAVMQYTRLALVGKDDITTRTDIIQAYRRATIQLTQEVLE
jgi:hypothetical protein